MERHSKWFTFGLIFILASCVSLTVNVYFPTTEIKQAAEEIEERIRTGQGSEGLESSYAPSPDRQKFAISLSFGGKEASAQDVKVDINIETPVIKKIIDTRTKRYKTISPYMDKALFGEGMTGFLVLRKTEGFDLKTLTTLKKLLNEENEDRELLYREILTANKLPVDKVNMEKVGTLFFEAIKKKMKEGHWYQTGKETWEEKVKKEQ